MIHNDEIMAMVDVDGIEELWDMHTSRMMGYGFDRIMYGFTQYRTSTSLGDPDDFVLLSNHSSDYIDGFIGKRLYHNAPMLNWALHNVGACSWSVLTDMIDTSTLTAEERSVYEFNQKLNVVAGYTISFKSVSPRAKGAIALTAKPGFSQADTDAIWQEHGDDIILLNNILHLRILSLPYATPSRSLTNRQREVLGWVGDGKTIQDIALLMELTPATIEKHLRLARDALSVETTAQAVLKAAFQNQMYILDA